MATKPKYEAEALYDVLLASPIKVGRTNVLPVHGLQLKGKIVAEHESDIIEATKVAS